MTDEKTLRSVSVDTLGLSHLRDSPFIDSLLFLFKESLDLF